MPPKLRRSSKQTPMAQRRGNTSTKTQTIEHQPGSSEMPTESRIQQTSKLLPAPVPFIWTTERSVELLFSMIGLKPAGKYLQLYK